MFSSIISSFSQDSNIKKDDTTLTCPHEKKFHIQDDREGSVICSNCSLVLQDQNLICTASESREQITDFEYYDKDEDTLRLNLKNIGTVYDETKQYDLLINWTENANLPPFIVYTCLRFYRTFFIALSDLPPKRRGYNFNLEDTTALALYRVLIKEKIPRSMTVIETLTGVSSKKLWRMETDFCSYDQDLNSIKASAWMSGISFYLPLSYKETQVICDKADSAQQLYSFSPITMLLTVIYNYIRDREWQKFLSGYYDNLKGGPVVSTYMASLRSSHEKLEAIKNEGRDKEHMKYWTHTNMLNENWLRNKLCSLGSITRATLSRALKNIRFKDIDIDWPIKSVDPSLNSI